MCAIVPLLTLCYFPMSLFTTTTLKRSSSVFLSVALACAAVLGTCAVIALATLPSSAHAAVTPTLTISAVGSTNNVQVTVQGDPNSSVLLFYTASGTGPQILPIGYTDQYGYFSTSLSSSSNGFVSGTLVQAGTGGTSGIRSSTVSWPTVSSSASGITLSQTGLALTVGQSTSIVANNANGNSIYVSTNSNAPIASVSINGTQITITGLTNGQTTITFCATGYSSGCPSIFVSVQNSGAPQISFSQNSLTIAQGQNVPITVSGGSGAYTILNNSNPSVIQSSISGAVVTLTGNNSTGSASITVCSTDMSSCGIINATAASTSSVNISFSNSTPQVASGQSTTVNVYGPSGSVYYLSSTSNTGIVQVNITGSVITLTGIANGSTSLTVCSSAGNCGTLSVTVNYQATGGNIALSQNTLALATNQTLTISISGGTAPYNVSGGSSNVAQLSLNGNLLTATGLSTGLSTVNVCSAGGGCIILSINVNGASGSTSSFTLSPNALTLLLGQNGSVTLYGSGSYYILSNTSSSIASGSLSGSTLIVSSLGLGTTNMTICQSGGTCATLPVTVTTNGTAGGTGNGTLSAGQIQSIISLLQSYGADAATLARVSAALNGQVVTPAPSPVPSPSRYVFTLFLSVGSKGTEVLRLQERLAQLGLYTGPITGTYGPLTGAAVARFQAQHGITQAGYVGPSTRTALNR